MFPSPLFFGMMYISGSMIGMECMDYSRWKIGRGTEAMVQAVVRFTNKAQVGLAGLAILFCLIPVGLGVAAAAVLVAYPLKRNERDRMYAELGKTSPRDSSA
jgi:Na+/melibiose symporter-like transporter